MRKWSRTIGLLFTAVVSVYSDQAFRVSAATPATPASPATPKPAELKPADPKPADLKPADFKPADSKPADSRSADKAGDKGDIKVVDDTDPFVNSAVADATTKPSEGTSVTNTDVSVNDAGTVEIHVNDANLVEVLRMLSLQSQKNIIASNQVTGHVTANLYGVTVREALDAILHANGYAYREKGNFIYVYTAKEIADMEKSERQATTQVFRLFYTPAANALVMIKPVMSAEGQVASTTAAGTGLPSGVGDTGGDTHATEDMLVVTDYPDNLEKVRKVLAEIDRRPQQILVEATILRATLSEDNALGVDFQVVGGVDFSSITSAMGQISGANVDDSKSDPSKHTVTGVGTGNSFSSQVPGGLKLGVVSNNVGVFLSALESTTDTTILANPKVLALNKQKGEVIVGRKDGYITTTVTENAQTQSVEFLDTGTRLVFRPFIGDDGYIRMEIHPEDSSGGLQGSANLPFKITTEVTSNVLVKDNHTIVIGGLFRESSNSGRGQIPGLGNLPLAGPLFRQTRDTTTREEVIILLTPHIVKDDEAYAKASEDEIKEMEKLRVGVRKGMMPWGRERLAESCYETAVAEMRKEHPDKCKVLWHLDCATNLNPKYLEAINLKEEITGKEVMSSDNSIARRFVVERIMAEKANPPAIQPLPRVVPIDPSTQPTSSVPMNPTTQPAVAEQSAATTQPAVAIDDVDDTDDEATVAPVIETADAAPTTKPATAPATVVAIPAAPAPVETAAPTVAKTQTAPAGRSVSLGVAPKTTPIILPEALPTKRTQVSDVDADDDR